MKMLFTKIVHRSLKIKKVIKIKSTGNKNILISYVLFPPAPFDFKFFFNVSHNRFLTCYLMAKALKLRGYNVYVYDYLDTKVNYNIDYDFFLGHNKFFSTIASKLNPKCKKILITTGSSPFYDNAKLASRQENLQDLLQTNDNFFSPQIDLDYVNKNIEIADSFFMIGNEKIATTWGIPKLKEICYFSNVNLLKFVKKKNRTGNFIYLSSVGQLRRGLDLILHGFIGKAEKVYICGDYSEPAFIKHFEKLLFNSPNIIPMGYIDQTSDRFLKMIDDADFAILPSCSEGQSGSVLTLMSYGLLPVITDEVGFSNYESYGVQIKDYSSKGILDAIDTCVLMTDNEIENKRSKLYEQSKLYTPEAFVDSFDKLLNF